MLSLSRTLIQWMQKKPFLFFLSVFALFSLSTAWLDITRIDVRFALMLQDMTTHPIGVFATLNGVEYPDYFSTYFLLSWLTTLCGQWVNLWSMSLPSILLGSWIVFMTWKVGSKFSPETGFYATLFSFLSLEYLCVFLGFGIDVPVAAAAVTMLYFLEKKPQSGWKEHALFALLLMFSFAMRGGLGLIVFGAATAGWLIAKLDWKRVITFGLVGAFSSVFCVGVLYSLIHLQGGEALWKGFMDWHVTSRMKDANLFYYFTAGLLSYAPGVILFLLTVVLFHKKLFTSETAGLMGFILFPMILLSIPGCQHLRYMTLCVPAIWVVAAWGMCRLPPANVWIGRLDICLRFLNRYLWLLLLLMWCTGITVLFVLHPDVNSAPFASWIIGGALTTMLFRYVRKDEYVIRLAASVGLYFLFAAFPLLVTLEESQTFAKRAMIGQNGKIFFFQVPVDHDDLKFILHIPQERRKDITYLRKKLYKEDNLYSRMYNVKSVADGFGEITPDDLVILRTRKDEVKALEEFAKTHSKAIQILRKGEMGHREFLAVRLVNK